MTNKCSEMIADLYKTAGGASGMVHCTISIYFQPMGKSSFKRRPYPAEQHTICTFHSQITSARNYLYTISVSTEHPKKKQTGHIP